MEGKVSVLFLCILIVSFSANLVAPSLTSASGCEGFPKDLQVLCQHGQGISESSTVTAEDIHQIAADASHREEREDDAIATKLILSKPASYRRKKANGCSVRNCRVCPDEMQCTQCKFSYFLQSSPDAEHSMCVRSCLPGFERHFSLQEGAICKKYRPECHIRHCNVCPDPLICSVCDRGYYPQFVANSEMIICVKKCFKGYAVKYDVSGRRSCQKVPLQDQKAAGCFDDKCTLCKRGYYMQATENHTPMCRKRCPKGYLKDRVRRVCVHWPR